MNDTLMSLNPKSSFEKLLWEKARTKELKKENKELRFEIGVLKSELDELKDSKELSKLATYKENLKHLQKKLRQYKMENEKLQRDLLIEKGLLTVSKLKDEA